MDNQNVLKSSQEQAVASWINYLNQIRINRLIESLSIENENWENATTTIKETLNIISKDIVNNGKGRGGQFGMHGFIAEVAECGIGNARSQIEGNAPVYKWINDNGPEDLRRGAVLIQQKFVQSGNHLSLQAIQQHLQTYPDFLKNGGVYQIPADHYEKIQWLLSISEKEANKMPTGTGDFSLKQWKEVHALFDKGVLPKEAIEPSKLDYKSVQKNSYEKTLHNEQKNLQKRNQERKDQAYQKSKPSFKEGAEATVVSAFIEGGMTLCLEIIKKRQEGKHISEFDKDDWSSIGKSSSIGFAKGGIRGISVYMLSNYTATPAAVANSLITASFGVAEQTHLYRSGEISQLEYIENSELLCLDAAVSALSSIAGQLLIPVPVLGAIIGNATGTILYKIGMNHLSKKEQLLIEEHLESIKETERELSEKYTRFINELIEDINLFFDILESAFAPDIRMAFNGSIELAILSGVPSEEILDSKEKIAGYFLT